MKKRIAIVGMGITSALGTGVQANFSALRKSVSGIKSLSILATKHKHLPCGEIAQTNHALREALQVLPTDFFTRGSLLGALAVKEAVLQAKLTTEEINSLAFVNGTSVGGMDFTEGFYEQHAADAQLAKYIEVQHPGFTTDTIANFFNFHGFVSTLSTACSSGANALLTGAKLITSGQADTVIAGGTDCLSKFTLNGFNSLMILSDELCKPFDANRKGLNLGEGAAYLVLMDEAKALEKEKPILAFLTGYGNANDAHHQTASSSTGEGSYLAMQKALTKADVSPESIDYINAHGTATLNNDQSEATALERIFNQVPAISSTKAFTGHTLAAAGAIEAVFSVLSLQHQVVFPNLNFTDVMPAFTFQPETKFIAANINHVLSNSFGFGGNCTSLVFSKA